MEIFVLFITSEITMNQFKKAIVLLLFAMSTSSFAATDPGMGFVNCKADDKKPIANCDYGYLSSLKVKDVSLKVDGVPLQIPKDGITIYPAEGQSSAILFLVDVSDPLRKNTVEVKNKQHLVEMMLQQKEYEKTGIAVFDSEISILSPIGSDEKENVKAINSITAKGQATEFYKNILAAIEILKKTDATRKGLVLMSDGKDEDRAYKYEDVIKAAREANIVILGLGYTEKPSDTPYLQTIKRLADATNGAFYDVPTSKLPVEIKTNPFDFLEKGGRVSFDSSKLYGDQKVELTLGLIEGDSVTLKTNFEFPDKRTLVEKTIDFVKSYWWVLILGLMILVVSSVLIRRALIKRALANQPEQIYGYLEEFDGSSTRHPINKTTMCIGRNRDNDICLINDSISSHHAEIHRKRDGGFNIVDLGSTNGVLVNGVKINQSVITAGDVIELGEVRLNFFIN
jgi:hypothetical protein